ncbi:MAG: translation initiation factor IF-2 [Deltaproteobacteria bacterium]|nr:translation initiation factor IF-2 [Deltaproteobacteria bacterium]
MGKVRIYSIAQRLNIKSSVVIDYLEKKGIKAANHFSTIDEETADKFVHEWQQKKAARVKSKIIRPKAAAKKVGEEREARRLAYEMRKKELIERATPRIFKERKKYAKRKKQEEETEKTVKIASDTTVYEFAKKIDVEISEVLSKLFQLGIMLRKNDFIDESAAGVIAEEYGWKLKKEEAREEKLLSGLAAESDEEKNLKLRSPVVTVMGHVDHGKTTLLDNIRKTRVAQGEAGGITQHIGAYMVAVDGHKITFLDTPGHEAFTEMRARGAKITDIVILVVAADDGVMPQTKEAIDHARAASVPIVVAINKIDKPNANPDKVKKELADYGIVPEEWGGDNLFTNISAKKGIGIDELLENVLLQADILELKSNPDKDARGVVVEALLDPAQGPVATVLVKEGTLRRGDVFVVGSTYGRARALISDAGGRIKEAGPSAPVRVLGIHGVPSAGDTFVVVKNEKIARQIAHERTVRKKELQVSLPKISLESLLAQAGKEVKELSIIIKTDVSGSIEAVSNAISRLSMDEVTINVIHAGTGAINKTDVNLASASGAMIVGFNVRPTMEAAKLAQDLKVGIRTYKVIYDVIDDIKKAQTGMLAPILEEEVLGQVEVREIFSAPHIGTIAGCYVRSGHVLRNMQVHVIRNDVVVYEGKIASLKRFKEDVPDVAAGYECGLKIENFNDVKVGDIIEVYRIKEVARE